MKIEEKKTIVEVGSGGGGRFGGGGGGGVGLVGVRVDENREVKFL